MQTFLMERQKDHKATKRQYLTKLAGLTYTPNSKSVKSISCDLHFFASSAESVGGNWLESARIVAFVWFSAVFGPSSFWTLLLKEDFGHCCRVSKDNSGYLTSSFAGVTLVFSSLSDIRVHASKNPGVWGRAPATLWTTHRFC